MAQKATTKPGKKAGAKKSGDATERQPLKASDVEPLITENQLRKLRSDLVELQAKIDKTVGTKRERIGFSVEKEHLDKDVFALAQRIDKWTPEQGAYRWPLLLRYLDALGTMKKFESAPGLEMGDGPTEDGDEADSAPKPGPAFGGVAAIAESAGASLGPGE